MTDFQTDGDPYEPPIEAANQGYADLPVSTGHAIGSLFGELTPSKLGRLYEREEAGEQENWATRLFLGAPFPQKEPQGPTLDADDANERYAPPGEKLFNEPVADSVARVIGKQRGEQIQRDDVLSRWSNSHSWPTRIGTELGVSLLDPLNAAAMFVPVVGEEAVLANLGRIGFDTSGMVARTGAKAVAGGASGGAVTAPVTALQYGLNRMEGQDYTVRDAFREMLLGAAAGAALHATFGAVGDVIRGRREPGTPEVQTESQALKLNSLAPSTKADASHVAVAQIVSGREVDVGPVIGPQQSPAETAGAQAELYRGGFAPGVPQSEFDDLNGVIYGSRDVEAHESPPPRTPQLPNDVFSADLEGQKTRIADDVTQHLMSAGRPREEAEAAGKLIAERYAARAARMGGALGTPEELYRSEGAVIRGGRGVEPVREAEMAQAEEPKLSVGRAKYIERRLSRKAPEELTEKQQGDLAAARRVLGVADPEKELYQPIGDAADETDLAKGFIAYHGTPYDFEKFSTDYASHQAEPGIFFSSSPAQAGAFANEAGGRVIPVNIKPTNPKIVDFSEGGHSVPYKGKAMQDAIKSAKEAGHDVLVVKGMREVQSRGATEGDQVIVLKPGVVKSAISPAKELYQRGPFYSAVGQAVDESRLTKGSPDQWLGTLKNAPGVKQQELDWIGLPEWLKEQKGPVTKEQVADYIRANQIEVRDVVKRGPNRPDDPDYIDFGRISDDPSDAKFSQYQLPGGDNYRELLLTLPQKEDAAATHLDPFYDLVTGEVAGHMPGNNPNVFRSGHFDEPNVLAHVRFNDRIDANGKKTLFLEEVQSDWHQKGRKEGYTDVAQQAPSWAEASGLGGGVPDAPFKTTWPELALKRMIRWAAEHGYDQIAWTPGDVQAARYDLSKQVDAIRAVKMEDGYLLGIKQPGRDGFNNMPGVSGHIPADKLADYVGKELADKIVKSPEIERFGQHDFSGLDLKVGGEGMAGFYDKMLPAAANKLGKKFGAKVETTHLKGMSDADLSRGRREFGADAYPDKLAKGQEVWSLPITDKMKDAALSQGFPLFQGARGKIALSEGRKPIITLMREANASTFIHETGHQWLEELMRDAQHPSAPGQLRDDADTVLGWLGAHSAEDIKTRHHEKFARGFEQYLREGVAPSPELAGVFARFKQWLLQIYQTLKGLGQPINEDIRQVFDRMLADEMMPTQIARSELASQLASAERDLALAGPVAKDDAILIASARQAEVDADLRGEAYAQAGSCLQEAFG